MLVIQAATMYHVPGTKISPITKSLRMGLAAGSENEADYSVMAMASIQQQSGDLPGYYIIQVCKYGH